MSISLLQAPRRQAHEVPPVPPIPRVLEDTARAVVADQLARSTLLADNLRVKSKVHPKSTSARSRTRPLRAIIGHLDSQARNLFEFPSSAAKTVVRCSRVRAERSSADCAAVPPPSARFRCKRAVAHDVEARFPTVVTPGFGARHPVDHVHRSSVLGCGFAVSPTISEVTVTDQQPTAQAPNCGPRRGRVSPQIAVLKSTKSPFSTVGHRGSHGHPHRLQGSRTRADTQAATQSPDSRRRRWQPWPAWTP